MPSKYLYNKVENKNKLIQVPSSIQQNNIEKSVAIPFCNFIKCFK